MIAELAHVMEHLLNFPASCPGAGSLVRDRYVCDVHCPAIHLHVGVKEEEGPEETLVFRQTGWGWWDGGMRRRQWTNAEVEGRVRGLGGEGVQPGDGGLWDIAGTVRPEGVLD